MESTRALHEAENIAKMGEVLFLTGDARQASSKLREACLAFEEIVMGQDRVPTSHVVLIQCFTRLGECHEKLREIDKALVFYQAKRMLLEFLAGHPQLRVQEELFLVPREEDEARLEMKEVFAKLHEGFDMDSESFNADDARRAVNAFRQEYELEQAALAREQAEQWREIARIRDENMSTVDRVCRVCESRFVLILIGVLGLLAALLPILYISSHATYHEPLRKPLFLEQDAIQKVAEFLESRRAQQEL